MKHISIQNVITSYVISMLVSIYTLLYLLALFVDVDQRYGLVFIGVIFPFLVAFIWAKIALRNKVVIYDDGLKKKVLFANIAILAILVIFIGQGSMMWLLYLCVSFIPVFIFSSGWFVKAMVADEQGDVDTSINKLKALRDAEITEYFRNNDMQVDGYFFANDTLSMGQYAFAGPLAAINSNYYIIAFDNEMVYFLELSKLSAKTIVNSESFLWEDIKINKFSSFLFGICYRIKMEVNGQKMSLQANKKIRNIANQRSDIEAFVRNRDM
jgi:hypothetical protein